MLSGSLRHAHRALLLAPCLVMTACAAELASGDEDDLGTVGEQLAYDEPDVNQQLPLDLPPGSGPGRFDFCPMDRDLNLRNARWLAWMSANAYGDHFGTWPEQRVPGIAQVRYPGAIFSAFSALGFGNPGEDALWARDGARIAEHWRRYGREDDALADFLFTQLHPARGMGKLHGTDPAGYEDGNAHFTAGSTQVYFIHNRRLRTAIVVFRGTQPTEGNGADVVADLDYDLVLLSDGANPSSTEDGVQVHRGFRTALYETTGRTSSIQARLLERLARVPAGTQLWITGHSLGGALANVFTLRALQEQQSRRGAPYELAGLVTFGSPEVGNLAFGSELRRRLESAGALHQRFVYGRDPVTRVVELGRDRVVLFRELDAYQHATRVEDYYRGWLGRTRGGGWADARHGSLEVQLPCTDSRARPGDVLFSSPVPESHARCATTPGELLEGQADHAIASYYDALVRAERYAPETHPARQCEQTERWQSTCTALTRCLSSLGGAACATETACPDGLCSDIRRCESEGDGGWGCFTAYCGTTPSVPAQVRECWSANGGWSCFRPR